MASAETVSFYCHTCSSRFSLPAPSSPFHFTLCPRCRRDYLDDSPMPHYQAPPPVLPPPPPPCAVPWPSRSINSSTLLSPPPTGSSPSSSSMTQRLRLRSSTIAETTSTSQDLPPPPPPLPPGLLQASASHDPWDCFSNSSDCPPRPTPPPLTHISSFSSSSTTLPRAQLVSPGTRPSTSSTGAPAPAATWDYFFGPSDPVVDASKETPPSNMSVRQVRESSPAISPVPSAYSSACSSPPLSSPRLHQQHRGELQPETSPLALSSSTTAETTPSSLDLLPPPPLLWDSPLHSAWDDESSDPDYESPPRPPPPPDSDDDSFETRLLQLRGRIRAAPPPVFAYHATFDTPLQHGGSQAAPTESIAALPTITVTDTALVCPICTDPLLALAPARRLPCDHLYHSGCIVTWLSLRNSCPVCRCSIPTFHSTAMDVVSSSSLSPSLHPTPHGRRRSLPGTRRIRRICSRLLR